MTKQQAKLVKNKKTGKRYLRYKNRKYIIKSNATDNYLIKNLLSIVKELIHKKKSVKHRRTNGKLAIRKFHLCT
jgi:hypothetical protein